MKHIITTLIALTLAASSAVAQSPTPTPFGSGSPVVVASPTPIAAPAPVTSISFPDQRARLTGPETDRIVTAMMGLAASVGKPIELPNGAKCVKISFDLFAPGAITVDGSGAHGYAGSVATIKYVPK